MARRWGFGALVSWWPRALRAWVEGARHTGDAGARRGARMGIGSQVSLGCVLGVIATGATTEWPPPAWLAWALCAGAVAWLARQRVLAVALFAAVATLAWLAASLSARALPTEPLDVALEGQVDGLPVPREDGTRFEFVVTRIIEPGNSPAAPGLRRVRLDWYRAPPPEAAAHCHLHVRLRAPRGFANPGAFDLAGWTLSRGIDALGSVREHSTNACVVAPVAARDVDPDHWRIRLRDALLRTGWPNAGVIVALALGDGSGLTDEQWRVLRATGTVHLLVISGLHVTMVATVAFVLALAALRAYPPLLRRGLARPCAAAAAMAAALAYAALAGFGVPTVRALLMSAAALAAVAFTRPQRWWVAWLASAALVLALQPLAWREPGCVLSYLGVGLLLWSLATERDVPASWWRRTARGWWRAQWLMLLATTPLLLAWFGQAPLSSPLGNLLAGPLVSGICVPLALVASLALPWLPQVADALLGVLDASLALLWWLLAWQATEVGFLRLLVVPHFVLLALGVGIALLPAGAPGRGLGLLAVAIACALAATPDLARGEFEVTTFDVGQGTSALVRTREHLLLVDAGPRYSPDFDAGAAVVVPALLSMGHAQLDRVLLSHGDNDHAGGFEGLAGGVAIGKVLAPHAEVVDAFTERCRAGVGWAWDGVTFSVLWPPPDELPAQENDRSCVLLVSGRQRALFPGDIGRRVERSLVARGAPGAVDLLLAAHHGSRSSSSPGFVMQVQPHTVVYTAASPSRFGHPHPEVRARYAGVGATAWVTGEVGAVTWRSDRGLIAAARCLADRRWQTPPAACAQVWRTIARDAATPAGAVSGHRR